MEPISNRRKPSKLEEFKPTIFQFVEKFVQKTGILVNNNCAFFVVVPVLVAVIFLALCFTSLTPVDPGQKNVPPVKDMFLALKEHPISIHRFEEEWWENSCYDPRNSRQSAHVIVTSKHDVLSKKMQNEIIRLHNYVTEIQVWNPIHGTMLTYSDVCMQPSVKSAYPIRNETIVCATDVIIEMYMCTKRYLFLSLNLRMDADTSTLWGFLDYTSGVNQSAIDTDSWCEKQVNKQVFFGESICMVDDHMQTEAILAGCLRINYFLKDLTARDNLKSSIWLRQLEKSLPNFDSNLLRSVAATTESINTQWREIVHLSVIHGLIYCLIHFLISLLLLSSDHNRFRAVYLSLIGVASLAMSLVSTYSLHLIVYQTPRFNMVLYEVFITVVHFLFFIVSMESYFQTYVLQISHGQIHNDDSFVEYYMKTVVSNIGYFLLFVITFGLAAIPDSLLSFRILCISSCLGCLFTLFYQTTFFPAALQLYSSRIHNAVEKIQIRMATVGKTSTEYSISESVFLDDDVATNTQAEHKPEEEEKDKDEKKVYKHKKFLSKLKQWYSRYAIYAVCDHMRAVSALLYLAYLSFSCVGCVHFTERISPKQLLSQDSNAYEYYTKTESYFGPFGTPFMVYGVFHGNPYDKKVVKELFQIHQSLMDMDTIDSSLSVNWFQFYYTSTMENHLYQNKNNFNTNKKLDNESDFSTVENNSENIWKKPIELNEEVWNQYDWYLSWNNFTQTKIYEEYKKDIIIVASDSAHHEGKKDISQIRFQWFYYTINVNPPSKQKELITHFQQILNRADTSVISLLVFDSPELDWSTSIKANRFTHSFVALVVIGLLMSLFWIALVKWKLAVVWCFGIVVSVEFGTVGFMSLFGVGCDPLSIPCVLFLIPCSMFVVLKQLMAFFKHSGGRAESASASLKNSCSRTAFFCMMLFFSSLTLSSGSSYVHQAPMIGLLVSTLILLLHYLLFVPFLLTVLPPQKKKQRCARQNQAAAPKVNEGINPSSPTTANTSANHQSEQSKELNSDTLKIPDKRRERKLERLEHVTSV